MTTLKSTIEGLATEFAMSIIHALRTASLDELTNMGTRDGRTGVRPVAAPVDARKRGRGRGSERLGRRSASDIDRMVEDVVALLSQHPEGLRSEQIRESLGCQAKELPRPLADALAEGRISKSGQKRATTYYVGSKPGDAGTTKRRRAGGRRKRG